MHSRRRFLGGIYLGLLGGALLFRPAAAQFRPFRLKLIREQNLASLLGINDCIIGKLYFVERFTSNETIGRAIRTLELPYRNNLNEISAIPPGIYHGLPRSDGSLGWRIQFSDTPSRKLIQIHPGNITEQTRGCILAGLSTAKAGCKVSSSRDAMTKIKLRYADATNSRPVELQVVE